MKLVIHQIKTNIETVLSEKQIAKKLGCSINDVVSFTIIKQSLDNHKKDKLQYSYTVVADIKHGLKYAKNSDVSNYIPYTFNIDKVKDNTNRPVVVGSGPSGLFTALTLAYSNAKPILIEMGKPVDERIKDINTFINTKQLNTKSNVQYGEGGAGTFSDGKLTCRIKDERIPWILQQFIQAGAKQEISYQALPHIGTDGLQKIIPNIREKIISLGGEVLFNSELTDIDIKDNKVAGITINNDTYIPCNDVFLCAGHSNINLYKMLHNKGITIVQKDISIGVRIEHPQSFINLARYHQYANNPLLPPASYNLTYQDNGVGIYTFCMCPGGNVMASNCENNTIVTNGMSYSARNGNYANAALLVQLSKDNYQSDNPLAGFDYINDLEKKAFNIAGNNYDAPGIYVKDFLNNTISDRKIISTYPFDVIPTDLSKLFGLSWCNHVKNALYNFDTKMHGYIHDDAVLVAIESKSSCPIRILRDFNTFQSVNTQGLYPCGEGSGYSGGIISSALDGTKSALKYIELHK